VNTPLVSEGEFRRIADVILGASTAEHTLVNFSESDSATLRFANNQVIQNVSERSPSVSVDVAYGQQSGSAQTNRLDDASLKSLVAKADAIAKVSPPDPEYLPPIGPQSYLSLRTFRSTTAEVTPMEAAEQVRDVVEQCKTNNLLGAGALTTSAGVRGVAASSGLFAYEAATSAEFSLTATHAGGGGFGDEDSSGWAMNAHRDVTSLGMKDRTGRAIRKAIESRKPTELDAGHYTVILEPAAVAGVFGSLLWSLGAKSYFKGDSALSGKLDQLIVDERLHLREDPAHDDLLGSRFDGQGLPYAPREWITSGVLKQLYWDRFTAKEHNVEPTPWLRTPVLSFDGPRAASIEELIAGTDRGILVTNFWYIRSVNPTDLTITGMTRDGTFLIENGKIVSGVKNFRFHDSPLRCFAKVNAATAPMEAITMERGKMLLPAVRLPDFNFSSSTKF